MTFDKETYRKNREEGIRGQGEKPVPIPTKLTGDDVPKGATISFDNDGHMVVKNRAYRRTPMRLPGADKGTKSKLNKKERKLFRKKGRK